MQGLPEQFAVNTRMVRIVELHKVSTEGHAPLEGGGLRVKLPLANAVAIEGCGEAVRESGVLAQAGVGVQRRRGRVGGRRSVSCRQWDACLGCIGRVGGCVGRGASLQARHLSQHAGSDQEAVE